MTFFQVKIIMTLLNSFPLASLLNQLLTLGNGLTIITRWTKQRPCSRCEMPLVIFGSVINPLQDATVWNHNALWSAQDESWIKLSTRAPLEGPDPCSLQPGRELAASDTKLWELYASWVSEAIWYNTQCFTFGKQNTKQHFGQVTYASFI